jgi:hypothetical protein
VIDGWRYFGYAPPGDDRCRLARNHTEYARCCVAKASRANPQPMFPILPACCASDASKGLRGRIWWGAGSMPPPPGQPSSG